MADDNANVWSDNTDSLITEIDEEIEGKYKFGLRDLFTNTSKYAKQQNIQVTISNMKEDANKYIDNIISEMANESKTMEYDLSKVDAMTKQLGQNISMQSRQHGIPLVKPLEVVRDTEREETIVFDSIDLETMKLIEKLISSSVFVADFSYQHRDYNIGSWLFGGSKNYTINVYLPPNTVMDTELSRDEINDLIDEAADMLK